MNSGINMDHHYESEAMQKPIKLDEAYKNSIALLIIGWNSAIISSVCERFIVIIYRGCIMT